MILIGLAAAIAVPMITGFALSLLIMRQCTIGKSFRLALAYGLGMGVLAHWMLFLDILKIKFSVIGIGVPLLVFSAVIIIIAGLLRRRDPSFAMTDEKPATPSEVSTYLDSAISIALCFYIAYYLFYIFWRAINVPVEAWDSLSSVAFKAKVFFYEGWLYHLKDMPPHPSYPLQLPLSMTWIALVLGKWSDQYIQIIYPCATLSFVVIAYFFLKTFTGRRWALFGVAMILSSNELVHHSAIAYRDQFLMYYTVTAIMLIILWSFKDDDALLLTAGFFAGFGSFTKLEGTPYIVILAFTLAFILRHKKETPVKEKIIKFLKFSIPAFLICSVFHIYKIAGGFPERENALELGIGNLSRIPAIFSSFWTDLFISGNWNIIWFLLVISLAVNIGKIGKRLEAKYLLFALAMFFGLYFGLSCFTSEFVWIAGEKSSTTISRLILHFFPLAPLLIVLLNYPEASRVSMSSLNPKKDTRTR